MSIEILYQDVSSLFGESGHHRLLADCFPSHTIHSGSLRETPYFIDNDVDILHIGYSTERHQKAIAAALVPHRERIRELIASGTTVLATGNGIDLLGHAIHYDDGTSVPGLGLYDFETECHLRVRLNKYILGHAGDIPITAYKTQFTEMTRGPGMADNPLFLVDDGFGARRGDNREGVRDGRVFGTSCVGPFLLLNPFFLREFLDQTGLDYVLPDYDEAMVDSFHARLEEFRAGEISQIMDEVGR